MHWTIRLLSYARIPHWLEWLAKSCIGRRARLMPNQALLASFADSPSHREEASRPIAVVLKAHVSDEASR